MAIIVAENFNIAETTNVNIRNALAARNWALGNTAIWTNSAIRTQVENGVTRTFLGMLNNYYNGSGVAFDAIGLPLTNNTNPFYLSFRLRFPYTAALSNVIEFGVDTQNSYSVGANRLLRVFNNGSQLMIYPGSGTSSSLNGAYIQLPFNQWTTIEVFRAADGKVTVWVDDFLLRGAPTFTNFAPNAANPRVWLGPYRSGGYVPSQPEWQISDVILVDAALPGLQYRVGSTGRVDAVPYTADITAEWAPPAGVTAAHNTLMTEFKATPDPNKILTGVTPGQRETYQMGAVPKSRADNDVVLAVGVERRANNAGGAAHTFASEIDVGAGNVEVDSVTLPAGTGYQYMPKFMDKKPDGSNWTMADVAAMKSGFVVKS
ncbi:hypothetical protein AB6J89_004725 [Salmonella enterica]